MLKFVFDCIEVAPVSPTVLAAHTYQSITQREPHIEKYSVTSVTDLVLSRRGEFVLLL